MLLTVHAASGQLPVKNTKEAKSRGCFVTMVDATGVDLSDENRIPLPLLQIPQLVAQMAGILTSAAYHFQVAPAFYLFDEGVGANAVALPPDPAHGKNAEVRYGARLLTQDLHEYILQQKNGFTLYEFSTEAIIGHEFAHIVQYLTDPKYLPSEATRDRELHADFMSGWFVARNAFGTPLTSQAIQDGSRAFFSRGSTEDAYFDPDSHGTQSERRAAFLAGVAIALQSRDQAFMAGTDYVRDHPSIQPKDPGS